MSDASEIDHPWGSDAENESLSSSSSILDDDDESFLEELAAAYRARARLEWKRKCRLRRKYVNDDGGANDAAVGEGEDEEGGDGDLSSEDLVWVLEELCDSDALSVASLEAIVEEEVVRTDDLACSTFFHRACFNRCITIDIAEKLFEIYPEAANIATDFYCLERHQDEKTESFPLHLACLNDRCDAAIVVEVLKRNHRAIDQMCAIGHEMQTGDYDHSLVEGLPLHYYLSRPCNIDIDTVKMLLKRDPSESLRSADAAAQFAPIHVLCCNPNVNDMHDVLQFLIEADPESVQFPGGYHRVPFLMACLNKSTTLTMMQLLFDYWPLAINQRDVCGCNALHLLSANAELDEEASTEIFHFLREESFVLFQEADHDEFLPIHVAARNKSPVFCQLLIDAYPESLNIGVDGSFPFHEACHHGLRLDTVEFLFEKNPELISRRDGDGCLPIHRAAQNRGEQAAAIIKFLLLHGPGGASMVSEHNPMHPLYRPLHFACNEHGVALDAVKVLFDDYPEAVYEVDGSGTDPVEISGRLEKSDIVSFLTEQLARVRKANKEPSARLPLHRALEENNTALGTFKLIIRDFPASLHTADCKGAIPFLIACEHASVDVVKHLLGMDDSFIDICDSSGNYPLHYACRGSNHGVVKFLLERNVPSISERSTANMLPFHILCTYGTIEGSCEDPDHLESLWRVLSAYPDALSGTLLCAETHLVGPPGTLKGQNS